MDLNRCYAEHQLALIRASIAATPAQVEGHRADARRVARLIAQERAARALDGAATTTDPFLLPRTR